MGLWAVGALTLCGGSTVGGLAAGQGDDAQIGTVLDTLVGTNEALAASSPVDSGGHGRAHAAAMLAERQGAGIGGVGPWLVLCRRSFADTSRR